MLLAAALAVLTLATVAAVALPLLRGTRAARERRAFDRAVYRDQLAEVERDVKRGIIPPEDAATATLEIERRLLAADAADREPPVRLGKSPVLAALVAIALAGGAAGLYLWRGSPETPDQSFASRAAERARLGQGHGPDVAEAIRQLETRLKERPQDLQGWLLFARSAASLGDWTKSTDAFKHALALKPGDPEIEDGYGEMLVAAADGIVTPEAHDLFAAVLAQAADDPTARYYLGLAEAQAGNPEGAIAAWQGLAGEIADPGLRQVLARRIAETATAANIPIPALAPPPAPSSRAGSAIPAPEPGAAAAVAGLPPDQQQAFIRSMVEGLATRLRSQPDDVEGWRRLAKAYGVLGERDRAVDAYEHAAKLKPDDVAIPLEEAQLLLKDFKPQEPLPMRALALLRQVEAREPNEPTALWFLGFAAAQGRRFEEAKGYWQRLLAQLPPDAPERQMLAAALASIKDK